MTSPTHEEDQERAEDTPARPWVWLAERLTGTQPAFPSSEQAAAVQEAARLMRGGVPVPRQVHVGPGQVLTLPESVLGGGVHVNVRAGVIFVVRRAPPLARAPIHRPGSPSFTPAEIEGFVQLVRAQGLHVTAVEQARAHQILRVRIDPADINAAAGHEEADQFHDDAGAVGEPAVGTHQARTP